MTASRADLELKPTPFAMCESCRRRMATILVAIEGVREPFLLCDECEAGGSVIERVGFTPPPMFATA